MKKTSLVFLFILCFSFFLRTYKLDQSPPGFYSDESLTGYEAYSILQTGRDQYGNFMPITFKAFGDYRPGLFLYTTVPFVWMFGLSEFAVRLPSAVFSTLTVAVVYFLSKEFFKNEKAALLGSLLLTLSPWSLQFARMSHDTNLSTLLVVCAIYVFVRAIHKKSMMLPISVFLFTLSLYVYYTTRVFIPLFSIVLLILFRKQLFLHKRAIAVSFCIGIATLLPLVGVLTNREQGWSRIDAVSLWTDPGITARIIQYRQEDVVDGSSLGRIFHNKIIETGKNFAGAFLSHFEPQFLLLNGDPVKLYNTPGNGILLWIEPFLLIIAIGQLWKNKFQYNYLLLMWGIFGLLPDTLTRLYPAAARIHLILPLVSIIGGYGWWQVWQWTDKKHIVGSIVKLFITFLIIGNSVYFLHAHFVHTQVAYAKEWHFGVKEIALEAQKRESHYDTIWVSKSAWGWVNFVFFQKYDPQTLQKEIVLSAKNEYGLGWVYRYGKYYFDDLPKDFDLSRNILYIAAPEEFPKGVRQLHIVYYPDRSEAFYMVESAALKEIYEQK